MTTGTLFTGGKFQAVNSQGVMPGALVYTYSAGTLNALATYTTSACTTPNANPVVCDANGQADIYFGPSTYRAIVKTAAGVTVYDEDNLVGSGSTSGALAVGYKSTSTGAVATTVGAKLDQELDAVLDFGCDNTGATNTTTALLAFYNACIAGPKRGFIPAGTYKVTPGVLAFDTANTDKTWPDIRTAGHYTTIFQVDSTSTVDAPILKWSNGTAASAVGKYWRGGSHGGLNIKDSRSQSTYTASHGISITGMWFTRFGVMRMDNLCGHGVHIPQNLYGGSNPDPYASTNIYWEGIECNNGGGFGLKNENWVGQDDWTVEWFRSISNALGGWFGIGSGCRVKSMTVYGAGWAFDDGCQTANTGGSPQRNWIDIAEFDNCQGCIRLNKTSITTFNRIRFIHRFQTTPNASAVYWPTTAMDLTGGTSPNVRDVNMYVFNRIEAGGVLANLGTFINGHSSGNLLNVRIETDYADNGALGVTDTWLAPTGVTFGSMPCLITKNSKKIFDSQDKAYSLAYGTNTVTVLSGGFAGASNFIAFVNQGFGTFSTYYDTSTYKFTCPRDGLYHLQACLPLTLTAGNRVRMGFYVDAAAGGATVYGCQFMYHSTSAAIQHYVIDTFVKLLKGDAIRVTADTNNGSTQTVTYNQVSTEVRFVVAEM